MALHRDELQANEAAATLCHSQGGGATVWRVIDDKLATDTAGELPATQLPEGGVVRVLSFYLA